MSPRRNRGTRGGYRPRARGGPNQRGAKKPPVAVVQAEAIEEENWDTPSEVVAAIPAPVVAVEEEKAAPVVVEEKPVKEEVTATQIRISNMPSIYNRDVSLSLLTPFFQC